MRTFLCQIPDQDDKDDWSEERGYDAEGAAQDFVERRDNDSAGELLQDPHRDHVDVLVREGNGPAQTFRVTCDYIKTYYAEPVIEVAVDQAPQETIP